MGRHRRMTLACDLIQANLDQATSLKQQAPSSKLQAPSFKKRFDMKDNPGYSTGRTAAGDPAVIGNGNGPIGVSSTRALRYPGGKCIVKMSRGGVTWCCQGYGFISSQWSLRLQASSDKPQAPSSKLQASSRKRLAP